MKADVDFVNFFFFPFYYLIAFLKKKITKELDESSLSRPVLK
jgi:hypothetical protein